MSAAPVLPLSLSPHVCILPSSDLTELLESGRLPPLHHLLQAFSPLPQVTTRTTTLATITHATFPLRFSDYRDIDTACKEDDNSRAGRTIDWISQRISKRAANWVERAEKEDYVNNNNLQTPWWLELERCIEGDHTPSHHEGWNHPVAVIMAASTLAPNPLQAVTELHNKYNETHLPHWVDPTRLQHTLIIHPTNSPLNSDEAMALYNATKRQYGLHTHLLAVSLSPPQEPVLAPSLLPELPLSPLPDATFSKPAYQRTEHLNLSQEDVAQFARFIREFTTMSLVPWMERCVAEWNETYVSTKRLSSKIFSSTRKWFGGTATNNPVMPPSAVSYSSTSSHSSNPIMSPTSPSLTSSPSQQRRLAEFATFLGDIKLSISIWETLRKEGRGGSEILPLLLSPSPAQAAHAASALGSLQQGDPGPSSQLRGMIYAVRWCAGIRGLAMQGGERWLEMAAGSIEEPPPAILLAQAALISARKGSTRRAAMWYAIAAQRMEKSGIRPLAVYFYRIAHALFGLRRPKPLSILFDDANPAKAVQWFDEILPSIEYSLGRIMYTSGDPERALRYFLGLLRESSSWNYADKDQSLTDALYIGDFKVAFEHLKATTGHGTFPADLHLPFSLSHPSETKVRLVHEGGSADENEEWEAYEQRWTQFWKPKSQGRIKKSGKAVVGEQFWVDVMVKNPLHVEITLTEFTVKVESSTFTEDISIETVDGVSLRPRESRIIPIAISCELPTSLKITHLNYSFLSLLSISESLAVRGPRLQQTAEQRQNAVYGPDLFPSMDIQEEGRQLELSLTRVYGSDHSITLFAGECVEFIFSLKNVGRGDVDDIWILHSPSIWVHLGQTDSSSTISDKIQVLTSKNTLAYPEPRYISLEHLHSSRSLSPGESLHLKTIVRAEILGSQAFTFMVIYREKQQNYFLSSKLRRVFDIVPLLELGVSARPSASDVLSWLINLEFENVGETSYMSITQVATASGNWVGNFDESNQVSTRIMKLPPLQMGRLCLHAIRGEENAEAAETTQFALQRLAAVLQGQQILDSGPPVLQVTYSYSRNPADAPFACTSSTENLMESARRSYTLNTLTEQFHQFSLNSLSALFPVRNPQSLDITVFWEIPSEKRQGFSLISNLFLGACHGPLNAIVREVERSNSRRIMYAETAREKAEIQKAILNSQWNAEMNPLVVRATSNTRIEHDFSTSACTIPVTFSIRNFSLTNHARFTLRLRATDAYKTSQAQNLPPNYVGLLTHRGSVKPFSSVAIKAKMWVTRPGIYGLNGWRLETELGGETAEPWQTHAIFHQESPAGEESIIVVVHKPS